MRWAESHGLRYAQFAQLRAVPGLWHGIFARHCLDGQGARPSAFNIGFDVGDSETLVQHNRRRMLAVAGSRSAVFARQVHGDVVAVWDRSAQRRQAGPVRDAVCLQGDALVTDQTGVSLVIQTADCQSVLMVDPERGVIANVHSGWRGSIANIVGRTIETMVSRFGCRPEHIAAAIGPSLGPCCAEFTNYREEIPLCYWHYRRPGNLFDFWQLTIDQLSGAGVPARQIAVSNICTRCNASTFFSYRGESGNTGRFAAVILLRHNEFTARIRG